ncbi:uncharacterized protein LOC107432344 [Ziziphus jujuba]|uniref:Uncharacterized protein LOC107432344 n=2 Tax=Ziziphus jujuba TaxID=326968 RepID=A0A6P4BIK8_ZIZJJ|nr:uncharacterized protein LOC107432344 [Ziziphus jujuba]KAH7512402.1 hypothetical protein FEM48_Zijuj12G0087100 [Ziziphus jujuba var. spinosa]
MVGPSNLKALHPHQVFSLKFPSSSSSTISSMEIKQLAHTLIFSHLCRFIRALSKAKSKATSLLINFLKENKPMQLLYTTRKNMIKNKEKNKKAKIFFGSFRLHYNWCSSTHVLPVPAPVYDGLMDTQFYYDSTWHSVIPTMSEQVVEDCPESQLSGYLEWLEKKDVHDKTTSMGDQSEAVVDINEIDRRADLFIASCHEKFMLEKQESYRRYQEMLARSM